MLTVAISQDATSFTLTHPLFATTLEVLQLKMTTDCGRVSTINVTGKIPTILNNSFVLNLVDVFPTSTPLKFKDGIYKFETTLQVLNGTDSTVSSNCVFVDYDLKCIIDTKDTVKMQKYKALQYGNECDSCDCATMCQIFNSLIVIVNDTNCGCP